MTEAVECALTVEGEGPPLILIHGIGAARDTWRFLTPLLRERFTVASYDLRGHGASPKSALPFGLDDLVADLENMRARAGFETAHIAGHSLGGMIGPAYARVHPGRVRSLGMLSTAAFRTDEDADRVMAVVRAMEEKGIPDILPTLKNRWYTDAFLAARGDIVERRMAQVIATDPDVFLTVFRIYATVEMSPWLHEIAAPTLVLTGENDGGCPPRLNRKIAAAMANAELAILPEYRHSLLLECGETVARRLIDFIERIET